MFNKKSVDYKQLYDHLLTNCATYFGVDVADDALLVAYEGISRHLLNVPSQVDDNLAEERDYQQTVNDASYRSQY